MSLSELSAPPVFGPTADPPQITARQVRQLALRCIDLVLTILLLIPLTPLFLVVAFLVRAQDGGPAIFGHRRIGRSGKYFDCLKFRSMVVDAPQQLDAHLSADPAAMAEWTLNQKLRNDPRTTRLGLFLRTSSLDELPQLFNVLRGDMSLVGPRPIVAGEVARYGRHFRHYCDVKPGVTGLWQVSGRNDVSYRRRVALDVAFARRPTVRAYVVILLMTLPAVLKRAGAY